MMSLARISMAMAVLCGVLHAGVDAEGNKRAQIAGEGGTYRADFIQKAGAMRLGPKELPERYIDVKMYRIAEIDVKDAETSHTIALVDKQEADWQDIQTLPVSNQVGAQAAYAEYETPMVLGLTPIRISNRCLIPNTDIEVKSDNGQVISTPTGALKFYMLIKNWPFFSAENTLKFTMRISAMMDGLLNNNYTVGVPPGKGKDKQQRITFGSLSGGPDLGYVEFPTFAQFKSVNDTNEENEGEFTDVVIKFDDQKEHGIDVIIGFSKIPSASRIYYDPVIALSPRAFEQPTTAPPTAKAGEVAGDASGTGPTTAKKQAGGATPDESDATSSFSVVSFASLFALQAMLFVLFQ